MLDIKNISREFAAQFILCVLIALSAPQTNLWPLFVFLVWVPFRNAFPNTTVHTTSSLAKVFLAGDFSNIGGLLIDILVQFIGAILGGWVAFIILESNSSAPALAEGADEGRAFVVLAVVVSFWAILNTSLKGEGFERNASAAFLWIGTVFAIQEIVPGAVGNISTDIGRIIAAKIKGDGDAADSDPTAAFNFDGTWIFIIAPLVGIIAAKCYLLLEGALEKIQCCDGKSGASPAGGHPQAVPQHDGASAMPMVSPQFGAQGHQVAHHHESGFRGTPHYG